MEDDRNNIGLAAFFKQDFDISHMRAQTFLYEDFLPDNYKEMPNGLKIYRNRMIYLTFLQMIASIFGMFFIIFRRSFIYLVINVLTVLLALCGIYGCINMHLIALLVHCLFTTSLTGGFFIYQIFDFFLVEDTSYGNKKRINDNYILFIFSLPYLIDLIVGLANYFFIAKISEYNNAKNSLLKEDIELITKNVTNDEIKDHLEQNKNTCAICLDKPRNTVIQPCGHVLACEDCVKSILAKSSIITPATCPICRKGISNYSKYYIA